MRGRTRRKRPRRKAPALCWGVGWARTQGRRRDPPQAMLLILGIVNDPTTAGLRDSQLAMSYTKPKED